MSDVIEDDELDEDAPPIEVIGLRSQYGDHLIHDGLNLTYFLIIDVDFPKGRIGSI